MQIRDSDTGTGGPSSSGTATYTASGTDEFTVTGDELKIDIPASDTAGWGAGTYVYDMQQIIAVLFVPGFTVCLP